jgi:ubiquinone/menaquinone biosynthesis C-methylase UbiE
MSPSLIQNLTMVLALKLGAFAKQEGIVGAARMPHSAQKIAVQKSWDPQATARCLLAMAAIGEPKPDTEAARLLELFQRLELPAHDGVKKWLADGDASGLKELDGLLEGRTADEAALLKYYGLIVNQFLRKDVIAEALKTNQSQARKALDIKSVQIFDHYLSKPHILETYAAGFAAINKPGNEKAAALIRESPGASLLDVGGGHGSFASIVTRVHPEFSKVEVYDLKETFQALAPLVKESTAASEGRLAWRSGSFFDTDAVNPEGLAGLKAEEKYDFVSLGWILHDWSDEQNVQILKRVRRHLKPGGRVFVLEKIKPPQLTGRMHLVDFIMLLMADGFERTLQEYQALFERAGLRYLEHFSNDSGRDLLQAGEMP